MARLLFVAALLIFANAEFLGQTATNDTFKTTSGVKETTTNVLKTTAGTIIKTSTAKAIKTTVPKVAQTTAEATDAVDVNCTFDKDNCGWENDKSSTIQWKSGKGKTSSFSTGPTGDHTTGAGQYLYIEGSSPATIGDFAIIKYQFTHSASKGCLSMFYHMHGRGIGTLEVIGQEPSGHRQTLWSLTGEQGNKWLPMTVSLTTDTTEVLIKAVRGKSPYSDIAIDDITFSNSPCPAKDLGILVSTKPVNCTFDLDTCGWQQSTSDELDWTRESGSTRTYDTGPNGDHTTGNGFYMYLEASSAGSSNSAELVYRYPRPMPGGCFSVWYHMYGSDIGSLTVSAGENSTNLQKLWSKSEEQGKQWKRLFVPLKNKTSLIKITGVRGDDFQGDIAIDDISVSRNSCDIVNPINCTFERSLCGWTQDKLSDKFDWFLRKGATPSDTTGPTGDHTTGSGNYLYIEASSKTRGDNASITYTFVNPVASGCLSFYYHMYGKNTGALNVSGVNAAGQRFLLWSKNGEQGLRWLSANVSITKQLQQIQITAEAGYSYKGDIAIDDVTFAPRACQTGSAVTKVQCPANFTAIANPQTNLGLFELTVDGTRHRLTLPVGKYPYEFVTSSGLTCHFPIYIYDPKMRQRLEFEARYSADCSLISQSFTRDLIMTSAQGHSSFIANLCKSDCQATAALTPEISCANDVMVIRWPTDSFYQPNATFVPPDVATSLSTRIRSQGMDILRITVATLVPPVIYPQLGADGSAARVVLQQHCTDGGEYHPTTNRCGA